MSKSKTLPWPPVILAMMSLPQRIKQTPAPTRSRTRTIIMVVMTLRFLDMGFLAFFSFLDDLVFLSFLLLGSSEAVSSPLCSSKLNT